MSTDYSGGQDPANSVMARLTEEAVSRGGNAVLAMRFETSPGELGTEICACGTACVASPVE